MPIYDDDGNEIDPTTIPIPDLCRKCEKFDDPHEKILCDLNRAGQMEESDFRCYAFVSLYGPLTDDIIN
jgi:hypothetical protein